MAGGGYAILQSNYDLEAQDAQKLADLAAHPIASGVGAMLPVMVITLTAWFLHRRKILRSTQSYSDQPDPTSAITPPCDSDVPSSHKRFEDGARHGDPFEIAGGEVLSGNMKAGLWARALVEGGDNESAARAAYVRMRVAELQMEGAAIR